MIELAPADGSRLLADAAQSDWDAIGALYDRYRDSALAVAMSVLADPVDAEDVVHDVFMDLPRMARTYDPHRGRPEQWLCRSVRNRAIDHVRRRSRRQSRVAPTNDGPESLLALVPSRAASPVDEAEAAEFLDLLGRLDPRYAHLVRLAFVDGWSHSAIARITGIPLGTVKTRLRNSMRQIREMLADPRRHTTSQREIEALGPGGSIVVVSPDAGFRRSIADHARGIAAVVSMTPRAWTDPSSVAMPATTPAAIVLDVSSGPIRGREAIGLVAGRGWDGVPLVIVRRGRALVDPPDRRGLTLVVGSTGMPELGLASAVCAVLTATSDPDQRARAIARLLQSGSLVIAGDRLGRVFTLSPAAATVLGWAPRQLTGTFMTDLTATPVADAERFWQELVSSGQWAGRTSIRRPIGPPVEAVATAWMVPSGGFMAAIAFAEESSRSAA